jgi:hypothetical protein
MPTPLDHVPLDLLVPLAVGLAVAAGLALLRARGWLPAPRAAAAASTADAAPPAGSASAQPADGTGDAWSRAEELTASALSGAERVEACRDRALRQVDAAEYALNELLDELRTVMPDAARDRVPAAEEAGALAGKRAAA